MVDGIATVPNMCTTVAAEIPRIDALTVAVMNTAMSTGSNPLLVEGVGGPPVPCPILPGPPPPPPPPLLPPPPLPLPVPIIGLASGSSVYITPGMICGPLPEALPCGIFPLPSVRVMAHLSRGLWVWSWRGVSVNVEILVASCTASVIPPCMCNMGAPQ